MYSTCIFCNSSLGANEAVEHFPVGRRLAFDAAKGRLWAVCPRCGRWNLSPLEERWEAIEECERRFRGTRVRTSTEQIGLARLAEGVDLVRIGRPLRPEFAAWRYGGQFGRRLRRSLLTTASVGAAGLGIAGAVAAGPLVLAAAAPLVIAAEALKAGLPRGPSSTESYRAQMGLRDDRGERMIESGRFFHRARMRTGAEYPGGWALDVTTSRVDPNAPANRQFAVEPVEHLLTGAAARRAVSVFMAGANGAGGTRDQVQDAVRRIEQAGSPERYYQHAEPDARRMGLGYREVWSMPVPVRLALEMATHEDAERRALEGELAELEQAWKDAEEIAAVADRLAVPPGVEKKLDAMRRHRLPPGS